MNIKKSVGMLILITAFLLPIYIFGTSVSATDSLGAYNISNYDIKINVMENNVLDITETIGVDFNEARHGIYRDIPMKNKVGRVDGTTSTNRVKITDVKCSHNFEVESENSNRRLKIGDENRYANEREIYVISYKYDLGEDGVKQFDELYFNIIGDGWDCRISNVSFTVNMPKEFDSSKLGFSTGKNGEFNSENVTYIVSGNGIKGELNSYLDPYEALTVRLELPEGYFVGERTQNKITILYSSIVAFAFMILMAYLWKKHGKDDKIIETVEFYPPGDYSSADVGYIYKGMADQKQIVSLIVYFADKGYLKIEETNKKNFKLTRLKDYYETDKDLEKATFDGLFKSGNEVTKKDLTDKFYTVLSDATMKLAKRYSKEKRLYTAKSTTYSIIGVLVGMVVSFIFAYFTFYEYTFDPGLSVGMGCVISLPIYIIYFAIQSSIMVAKEKKGKEIGETKTKITFITLAILIIVAFILNITQIANLLAKQISLAYILVNVICILVGTTFVVAMKKRTEYGSQMIGKIEGFRNFLNTSEKEQLEAMVEKDPKYFYSILPYAYVLGVSDKWMKKFEDIAIEPPGWYDSNTAFNMIMFNHFMNDTMTAATSAMTSSPGGSSSGGGFSGGGSGGGGGGSW